MQLDEFLKDSKPENTIVIMDFDGTLHRGLFLRYFKGRANADLGLELLSISFLRPWRSVPLFVGLLQLFLLERRLKRDYKAGRISLSDFDETMIRFFASKVLPICTHDDIQGAAWPVSALAYEKAWHCLSDLKGRCSFVIISKSYEFLLHKVVLRALEFHRLELEFHGVKLGDDGEILADSVVSREDKGTKTKQFLSRKPQIKKAVILGDTEDDIAMKDAATDLLGASNVLFIAMKAKDRKIIEASNLAFKSWENLTINRNDRKNQNGINV